MRATALLFVLAAGAVGQGGLRKPLFGQIGGDGNKCKTYSLQSMTRARGSVTHALVPTP